MKSLKSFIVPKVLGWRGAGRYTKLTDFTKKASLLKKKRLKKLDVCILVFVGVSSHCVGHVGGNGVGHAGGGHGVGHAGGCSLVRGGLGGCSVLKEAAAACWLFHNGEEFRAFCKRPEHL